MKKLALITGFLTLMLIPVLSQQRADSYSRQDTDSIRTYFHNTPQHLKRIREVRENAFIDDNMPCVKPKGKYPSLYVKPDSTLRHSLLIKRP